MDTPKTSRDMPVLPPASRLSLLRVVEPALGSAPTTPTAMLATPCASSSRSLSRRVRVSSSIVEPASAVCRLDIMATAAANSSSGPALSNNSPLLM